MGSTLFFVGYPLGAFLMGLVGDWLGRKWLATGFLMLTGFVNCISALLSNYDTFVAFRAVSDEETRGNDLGNKLYS